MLTLKSHIGKSELPIASSSTLGHRASATSPEVSATPPLVYSPTLPESTASLPSASAYLDGKKKCLNSSDCADEKGERRNEILEQYLKQITEREAKDNGYRQRKERRERMKIRALRKIGKELEGIANLQFEVLRKQDLILAAISQSSK